MDHTSPGVGLLAVFAVSGSVAFIARLVHKRLVADFMNKIELETTGGSGKLWQMKKKKKKVRFREDVIVRECRGGRGRECVMMMRKTEDHMPLNRQLIEYKTLMKP